MTGGSGPAGAAQPPEPTGLTPEQLAVIAVSLAELAGRVESIRQRLAVLEAAVQSSRGSTICSTRDSRSSTRPRSS